VCENENKFGPTTDQDRMSYHTHTQTSSATLVLVLEVQWEKPNGKARTAHCMH